MKEYNEEDYLMLSGIQHFSFCRRQWALIHLEQQWAENLSTAEGRVEHTRCHDNSICEKRGNVITIRGLRVVSHELKLTGECDVVEFYTSPDGINIQYSDGKWLPFPVEYKHGHSKSNDADRLQLCAQAMSLEEMLVCSIPKGAIYYHQTRQREYVEFDDEMRKKTKDMANEMWGYFMRAQTPKVKTSNKCKVCSMKSVCIPQLCKSIDVKKYIEEAMAE